jgi:starch phosphorylase
LYAKGDYNPKIYYDAHDDIREAVDQLTNGFFNTRKGLFNDIKNTLLYEDRFFVLKDLKAYQQAHENLNEAYKNRHAWVKSALVNIAKSGYFSSDRTIENYADDIWKIKPIK